MASVILYRGVNINKAKIFALTSKIYLIKNQINKQFFRNIHLEEYNFNTKEVIEENFLTNIMLISINLPQQKNILTENALDLLSESIRKFNLEKDLTVAVLHGVGGNFCTGIELNENSLKKGEKLIKDLYNLKKPILVSLNGNTTDFGCQLAIMCDLKSMDETALIGFGKNNLRSDIPSEVYERLVATVGLSAAMSMVLTTCTWNACEAQRVNFVNRVVACGSSLGQAITWARSIAMVPCESAIKQKSRILSLLSKQLLIA